MQIPSIPPPIVTNALSEDVIAKVAPRMQAASALIANAVTAAPKNEKANQRRANRDGERNKDEEGSPESKGKRGSSVNIRV